jgi:hypothetical protein
MCARESKEMNIDEKMEMVMANEEVKNLSHKEKRAARPAFFLPHLAVGLRTDNATRVSSSATARGTSQSKDH